MWQPAFITVQIMSEPHQLVKVWAMYQSAIWRQYIVKDLLGSLILFSIGVASQKNKKNKKMPGLSCGVFPIVAGGQVVGKARHPSPGSRAPSIHH